MSAVKEAPAPNTTGSGAENVNDFQIVVATSNGSGSQTSNLTLIRTLFKMGLPVSGKNLFPSNIQGLPTWYTIRVSKDGYVARREAAEVLVAMNLDTASEDIANLPSGGVCLYRAEWDNLINHREDVTYYAMPVEELVKVAEIKDRKLRKYTENMVYVGVIAELFGLDMDEIEQALLYHFGGREKPVKPNIMVIKHAAEWARENLSKADAFRFEPMERKEEGMFLIEGNTASAMGAVFGGVSVAAWYPITPSTGVIDALDHFLREYRHDEDGKATYSVVQAEDELAAIAMVIGAGWAGARAMTATSGPGISLMAENIGLAYQAEIPAVVWNIQRMGPSTGLPTRTSQGDLLSTYFLSHGDTRHVILLPANMKECFECGWKALDLADQLQTPVFVLSDLDLGMNTWMTEPFDYPDTPIERGKVLSKEDIEKLGGFNRYEDTEGDGIGPRTLPGTDHPQAAYFTRGSGHNHKAQYSERPEDWIAHMERLARKHETARNLVPEPIIDEMEGAEIAILAYGSSDAPVQEARDRLAKEGVKTSYLRVRALPFHKSVGEYMHHHERVYVIDNNTEGQMAQLLQLEYPGDVAHVRSVAYADGLSLTARYITNVIMEWEEKK